MTNTDIIIALLVVSTFASLAFWGLPKSYALKFMLVYHAFGKNTEKYDFEATLKNHQKFALFFLIYSLITLFLAQISGQEVPDIAIWIFFALALIGSFWQNPVKRK